MRFLCLKTKEYRKLVLSVSPGMAQLRRGTHFFLEEKEQKNFWVKIYGLTELKLYMKTFSPHLACQDVSLMP